MLMMRPCRRAIMEGRAARVTFSTVPRLMSISPCQLAGSESAKSPMALLPPTLLTSTSMAPKCSRAAATMRSPASASSRSTARNRAPAAPRRRASPISAVPATWSRPTATRLAPSAARARATARPMLEVAPVTMAVLVASPKSMIVLIVVVGEGHCGTDQGPAARPGFRQNGQTFPEKARPETARRSPKPLGFPRSCWSLPATDSFCDPADLSAGLSAPQHGVGGVGRIPPPPAFGDAGGDVHQLVEVVDIGAVVDGPAPVPAGPAVHIAAPGDGLHQSALLAETQGGGDIGLAAGAVAVQLNEDIGHLMGVAEHGAVLLAHPVDKAPAAAAVHRAVIGAAVGVPDAVAELVVDAVHGPAVAVDLLADRLAVGEGLVAVVHGGSSGCKRSLQSHTRGRAVGCTMPPRWVLMMAPGA